jgi:endonuclease/exonuclease/phosphatase (EEP) superfamily protein YafD
MTRISILLLILLTLTACDYSAVRIPFHLSGGNYTEASISSETIKVLNWNIHKETGESNWQRDFTAILQDKKPDIVLLQEVRLSASHTSAFLTESNLGWAFAPNVYQSKYDAYSGVLIASTVKPKLIKASLSNGLEPITSTPKAMLFTSYQLEDKNVDILVVNVHGLNFQISADKFKAQLRYIMEFLVRHEGPVIMAGDFNSWNDARLVHLRRVTQAAGLASVAYKAEAITSRFGNPLDHIFYKAADFDVVAETPAVLENIESSDHRALFVALRLK